MEEVEIVFTKANDLWKSEQQGKTRPGWSQWLWDQTLAEAGEAQPQSDDGWTIKAQASTSL